MSPESSKTIKRISVINADTGIEIYQKDYEPSFFLDKDNQLISGFISALVQFSQEIVKDNIQEMVFSNSQLYLMRFPTVLIVILTPIGIPHEKVLPIFETLGPEIESNFTSDQLDFVTPELSIEIETVVDKCLEKDVQFPTYNNQYHQGFQSHKFQASYTLQVLHLSSPFLKHQRYCIRIDSMQYVHIQE